LSTSALSYVHGGCARSLLGQTIGRCFDQMTDEAADRLALIVVHQNIRWTYWQLREEVDNFAAGLLALGLQPGDRVGIWAPNCAEWVVTQFATSKAGLVLVTINPAYRAAEVEFVLNRVDCRALVVAPSHKYSDYLSILAEIAPELNRAGSGELQATRLPALRHVIAIGERAPPSGRVFKDVSAGATDASRRELLRISDEAQIDDPINIQFTSGTTGAPKGATLSHNNILNNGFFVAEAMQLRASERVCIPVPLYHCFGMVMGNIGCLTHGAVMVYPDAGFNAVNTLATVEKEECNALFGVPTMFIAMLADPSFSGYKLDSLRTGIMAGASCPIETMRSVMSRMHMTGVTIAYGMTETSPVSFQSAIGDPVELRVSTVGRVHPHIEVKIVGPDGRILPRGEQGEICTRGYSVMLGYWGDDTATDRVIDNAGWLHTGDIGVLDGGGYCSIVGRIKDVVIRGGENIYPREVEEFLFGHELIRDVQVFGIPDPHFGEELCAWIILHANARLSEDEIVSYCRGRIAHYKIPRVIRFVDQFPTTVTGKVQKFAMREAMIQAVQVEAG
jgi:fatty-acyl-CoA synthase